MMRIYRQQTGGGWSDVSDYIVRISGLERRHNIDCSPVAACAKLSFAVIEPEVDDRLRVDLDGTPIMLFDVETVEYDRDSRLWKAEAVDPLAKLRKLRVFDVSHAWWSGLLNPDLAEYKWIYGGFNMWDEQYISAVFMLAAMIERATGVSFDRGYAASNASGYSYKPNTWAAPISIPRNRLALNLKELRHLGVTEPNEPYYSTLDCFDLLQWICRALRCGVVYTDGAYRLLPYNNGYQSIDADHYFKRDHKPHRLYDSVTARGKQVDAEKLYSGWQSGVEDWTNDDVADLDTESPVAEQPAERKGFTLPANFRLHRCHAPATHKIFVLERSDHLSFIDQFAQLVSGDYTVVRETETVETLWDYYNPAKFAWQVRFDPQKNLMRLKQQRQVGGATP
ncbi:MAG: hypothetical protein K8R90_05135 [Candidatus Cloacimonetes bacterium]|nr:hypothetical protein [Candidatus Cloacimonadota bacterium]